MKRFNLIIISVLFSCSVIIAQDENTEPQRKPLSGLYGIVSYVKYSDFPLTTELDMFNLSPTPYRSNASSVGLGVGISAAPILFSHGYGAAEFEFSWANFSDPNVSKKTFYFFNLYIDIGIAIYDKFGFAVFGSFGGGLIYHSEGSDNDYPQSFFDMNDFTPGYNQDYYLEKYTGGVMLGGGVRISPIPAILLTFRYYAIYNSASELDFDNPGPSANTYYTKPSFEDIGNRISISISYVFNIKD